jgi:serine/threonine protein kinase
MSRMGSPGRVRVAPWNPSATREEARAYVESRLALFSVLMFWVFWILVGFLYAMYALWPQIPQTNVGYVFRCALAGQLVFALVWYVALRRRRLSLEWLYRVDAFFLIVIGLEFGNSAYAQSELPAAIYNAMIWHNFAILARTLIVPSSGRRTLIVTSLSLVPLVAAAVALAVWKPHRLDVPPAALVIGTTVISAIAVWLATTGSKLIYGLRRQVTEAVQLGQYTLQERIGEGGMGTVHRARHAMLRRPTAIKLLRADRLDGASLKRFEREVQNMSRLSHPNTVPIFDYGRAEGGFYYAMEFLDGIDLERLVQYEGAQPAARVARILAHVCGALGEAHGLGLTHRDIKPGNIILCCRGGQADVAMVVDFGLVKEFKRDDEQSRTRVVAGTPAYMSPEAVTDPDRVGPASDLYSLGATAYFLLTGTRVFQGKTDIHLCTLHVAEPPEPPSRRTTNPIPADLEALVLQCLAKDPAARPASAAALRAAVRALPVYRQWDEAAAAVWWSEFRQRPTDPGMPAASPVTITREVGPRTEPDLDTAAAPVNDVGEPQRERAETRQRRK